MITTDNNYQDFGKAIWEWVRDSGTEFFYAEESESILEIAERFGLVRRVNYDPDVHGEIDAEKGDSIWYFGDSKYGG